MFNTHSPRKFFHPNYAWVHTYITTNKTLSLEYQCAKYKSENLVPIYLKLLEY